MNLEEIKEWVEDNRLCARTPQMIVEHLIEEVERLENELHLLASEMVYQGNSVQHWAQKARAYKDAVGKGYENGCKQTATRCAEIVHEKATYDDQCDRTIEAIRKEFNL